jgi:hypothetical protein
MNWDLFSLSIDKLLADYGEHYAIAFYANLK